MDRLPKRPTILEFLTVIWQDWSTRVSGGLSVPFTILTLFLGNSYAKIVFGCLSILGIAFTVYRTWARERLAVIAEHEQMESQTGSKLIFARIEVSLELRRLEASRAKEAFIRLDNASEVGVTVTRLVVTAQVKGNKGKRAELPLNLYLGPHQHRELEGSTLIREAVWQAVPASLNIDGQHEATVDFEPQYKAGERNTFSGFIRYHVEFGGIHFQKATVEQV